jgi:hypothetical protein
MDIIPFFRSRLSTPEIKYILLMFFSTRIVLSIIGVLSRKTLAPLNVAQPSWTNNIWLDIWGVWDTGWYSNISQNGYVINSLDQVISQQTSIAFFPLYPLLMRFLGSIVGNDYIAGLIISNLFLIVSCIYLYRLVRLDSDEDSAIRSIKYLLLFPVSFILSGVFTEAMYLALTLMCFYYARIGRWQLAGIMGFFLSLTRSTGVLIVLPLLYEGLMPLLKENKGLKSFKNARGKILPLFYLSLIPLGMISFMIFNYHLTGDFMAFAHAQITWGRHLANPLETLINGYQGNIYAAFEAVFAAVSIFVLILSYRKIRFSYWFFGMYSIFVPLSTGIQSMPRFMLVIFPIYIIFVDITKNRFSEDLVMIFFALLQGFLMVFWTNSFNLVV